MAKVITEFLILIKFLERSIIMIFENKIGALFNSIAQRLVYSYIASYSKFTPVNLNEASVESQKQTHIFLFETLTKIYDNPVIIGLPLDEDDCFDGEMYKDKPDLYLTMKKTEKSFLGFFNLLFQLGIYGEVLNNKLIVPKAQKSLAKNKLILLENIGLKYDITSDGVLLYSDKYPDFIPSFKYLCMAVNFVDGKDIAKAVIGQGRARLLFMRCIFDINTISFDKLYGDLEQSGSYLKELEETLLTRGFKNIFYDASFSLHKEYPNKQDGSLTVIFNWNRKNQLVYDVDIPNLKIILEHFDEFDNELQEVIFNRTNNCSLCGYCTKTGKKEIVAVPIEKNGVTINKCPYYPYFKWRQLNESAVTVIKKLFDIADKILL